MDEDFEEWKAWFDSHKDENGDIDLSKHPHLVGHLTNTLGLKTKTIDDLDLYNLGSSVNFDSGIKHG